MTRRITTALTAGLFVSGILLSTPAAAQTNPGAFRCPIDDEVFFWFEPFEEQLEALSHNRGTEQLVLEIVDNWDARWITEQCERAARGESADFGCLHDRRDWAAIEAAIPANIESFSNREANQYTSVLRSDEYDRREAFWRCHDLGVIDRSLQQ